MLAFGDLHPQRMGCKGALATGSAAVSGIAGAALIGAALCRGERGRAIDKT